MAARRRAGASTVRGLYPAIRPYRTGRLRVSALHEIYFEESGTPRGKPVVFLHGGPGGATSPAMRRFFDPRCYRIVLFDQRGCGRSRPHASLVENTTWHLVADIETLRRHLDIGCWQVFGGSWGSTLALAYAQQHPQRVTELVLRGIFLLRRSELEWFYQNAEGAASLFPDRWEQYIAPIPLRERHDLMRAYHRRLTSRSRRVRNTAARAWSVWEAATSFLRASAGYIARFDDPDYAAAFARIECHYFVNGGFLERDDQLLRDVRRIRHIPAVIVQGRYDVVCPMRSAWQLHRAWPEASLRIVPDAGHSAMEPGITAELVAATDRFARATRRARAPRSARGRPAA
ncbi:MAG: prolyl aminopeptidase [Gammaproteobacteria bacterium]|nr:prolyl aminopeptidase [Gammaproteobacteria bacterium]